MKLLNITIAIGIWLILPGNVVAQSTSLSHNLIKNSYMDVLDGSKPLGFDAYGGTLTLEAVHPYTKGFEGPYTSTAPSGASTTIAGATENSPYWFGYYNKGSRLNRGGMASGWHGYLGGHILKIIGDNSGTHAAVFLPIERNVATTKVHLRAWVKIVSGDVVSFGPDAGYNHNVRGVSVTKAQADAAIDGWFRIDAEVTLPQITSLDALAFSMGVKGTNVEVYLALPHLSVVDDGESWMPSVSDYLVRNGLQPGSNTLSIGQIEVPSGYAFAVDGKAIMEEVNVSLSDTWPDYVFEDEYKLTPLEELEAFLKANKHLPGVPSAKEVKKEGISLGAMDAILLQKIEELTLHMINLQKENNTLKKEIKELKNEKE